MIIKVHIDHDAEELTDGRHETLQFRAINRREHFFWR